MQLNYKCFSSVERPFPAITAQHACILRCVSFSTVYFGTYCRLKVLFYVHHKLHPIATKENILLLESEESPITIQILAGMKDINIKANPSVVDRVFIADFQNLSVQLCTKLLESTLQQTEHYSTISASKTCQSQRLSKQSSDTFHLWIELVEIRRKWGESPCYLYYPHHPHHHKTLQN
jgi:hypothetical protein